MSYFKALAHYFSNLAGAKHVYLVHRFRRTKFAQLNLFYLARLNLVPFVYLFLICRAKQTSQNLTCCLFSSFVYLFSSYDKVKTVNKLFSLYKLRKQQFADAFRYRNFKKFCNIDRKTPMLESLKKRFRHRSFPVNITKFLRTGFLQSNSGLPVVKAAIEGIL